MKRTDSASPSVCGGVCVCVYVLSATNELHSSVSENHSRSSGCQWNVSTIDVLQGVREKSVNMKTCATEAADHQMQIRWESKSKTFFSLSLQSSGETLVTNGTGSPR